jgi:hypothetical protein
LEGLKVKIHIIDNNGTDDWGTHEDVDRVQISMPVIIDGLANERGIQITTIGTPMVTGDPSIINIAPYFDS